MFGEALHTAAGAAFILWLLGIIGMLLDGEAWILERPIILIATYAILFLPIFLWALWYHRR